MNILQVKQKLLNLPDVEVTERVQTRVDYFYYQGKSIDLEAAKNDPILLGQNWISNDKVDYNQVQDIRNKVKPLLKKQARFMFGKEPTISIKPNDFKNKEKCEEIRQFIDDIFENNKFWKRTKQAFLNSTIKKRVLLRMEINPGIPIRLKYEDIENFSYSEVEGELTLVRFFEEDINNINKIDSKDMIYYIHTYYYDKIEKDKEVSNTNPIKVWYKKEEFKGDKLDKPILLQNENTGLDKIPCWLIKNGGDLDEPFGETDLSDLKDAQNQYNKKVSDFAEAIAFQMFGVPSIIDAEPEDVENFVVAPGAIHAMRTRQDSDKQAQYKINEYNMSNSQAVDSYLDRAQRDMEFIMDMPSLKDLNNIPSAKAMRYLYNDLIIRCEDKWTDWEPVFRELIEYILSVAKMCYDSIPVGYNTIPFTIILKHNYPLPSDEEEKKKLGMEEVKNNVRSVKSYIKEFTDEEDSEAAFNEIIAENKMLNEAEMTDSFQTGVTQELDDQGALNE